MTYQHPEEVWSLGSPLQFDCKSALKERADFFSHPTGKITITIRIHKYSLYEDKFKKTSK